MCKYKTRIHVLILNSWKHSDDGVKMANVKS
jgi:hypothetical protein